MGTFTIIEYVGQGQQGGNGLPCAQQPPVAVQAAITTSGSSQLSAALNAQTTVVLVQTTSTVRYLFGVGSPTAISTTSERMVADGEKYHFVEKGSTNIKIAVIDAS